MASLRAAVLRPPWEQWTARTTVPTTPMWTLPSLLVTGQPSVHPTCMHMPWSCLQDTSRKARKSGELNTIKGVYKLYKERACNSHRWWNIKNSNKRVGGWGCVHARPIAKCIYSVLFLVTIEDFAVWTTCMLSPRRVYYALDTISPRRVYMPLIPSMITNGLSQYPQREVVPYYWANCGLGLVQRPTCIHMALPLRYAPPDGNFGPILQFFLRGVGHKGEKTTIDVI